MRNVTVCKCKRCGKLLYWDGKKFLDYANLDVVFRAYKNGGIRKIFQDNLQLHPCGDGKTGICVGIYEIGEEGKKE